MPSILTEARLSVWQAVDNWPELASPLDNDGQPVNATGRAFNSTFRFDDDMAVIAEISPAMADLPALVIAPAAVRPAWYTQEMQNWPYFLEVTLFTQDWSLSQAESLIEKIVNAVFRAHADGSSVGYVKAACGYHPRLGDISFTPKRVGKDSKLKVMETRLSIALRLQKDPFN